MNMRRTAKIGGLASLLLLAGVLLSPSVIPVIGNMVAPAHASSGATRILIQDYSTWPPTVYCDITTLYQARITNNGAGMISLATSGNPVCTAPEYIPIVILPNQ